MWEQLLGQSGTEDRVGKILALTTRLRDIQSAADCIRYNEQLSLEIPDVLKTLGDAKDAVIAELKLV